MDGSCVMVFEDANSNQPADGDQDAVEIQEATSNHIRRLSC